jgi:hypothetical protein
MTTVREETARKETSRLADLLRREHHALAEFLIALAAFDRERRWVDLGYKSLFAFLRRELHLSAGAAQYRKTAAELIQQHPEVEVALRDGRLCLSSVVEVAKVITAENVSEVLPRFFGLSSRDAAFVAASIRPIEAPPRRDFIVTPVRQPDAQAISRYEAPPTTTATPPANDFQLRAPEPDAPSRALSAVPAPGARPAAVPAATTVEPLDGERVRIHMTVSRRFLDKLDAARDALSHSHPGASRDQVIEVGLDLINERQARRRGLVKNPRRKTPAHTDPTRPTNDTAAPAKDPGRYVAADVRRAIWERDQGKCQWKLEGGGICGETRRVELDHIEPFAKGGRILMPEDGRVLCNFHQDVSARREFGDDLMNSYTRAKGGACSELVAAYRASAGERARVVHLAFPPWRSAGDANLGRWPRRGSRIPGAGTRSPPPSAPSTARGSRSTGRRPFRTSSAAAIRSRESTSTASTIRLTGTT